MRSRQEIGLEADVLGSLEGVQGMPGGYEKQAGLRNVKEKLIWSSGWDGSWFGELGSGLCGNVEETQCHGEIG